MNSKLYFFKEGQMWYNISVTKYFKLLKRMFKNIDAAITWRDFLSGYCNAVYAILCLLQVQKYGF